MSTVPHQPGDDRGSCPRDDISVLVVDGEQALAQALARALLDEPCIGAARASADPDDAARVLDAGGVDVVVVATDAADWDPLAFAREVRRSRPDTAIVAMSADASPAQVAAAVRAGASSWVSKHATVRELASVVGGAGNGEAFLPPPVLMPVLRLLTASLAQAESESVLARLTAREREVLDYTAAGMSRREIAARLHVSVNTVRTHFQRMLGKLGVHTTLEAVALVLRELPDAGGRRERS
jgi:DNA-binding NarL/FixJ family response regulator